MAQKNITFDIGGKIKEASGSYYDDVSNTLVLKNVSAENISLPNLPDGIAFVSGTVISSSGGAVNGKVVTWDATAGRWGFTTPTYIDVNAANPTIPAGSDISGQFNSTTTGILVTNLSNVNSGTPLPVNRGGTGLSASAIPNGESLLIGNGTDPLTFVTASAASLRSALLSNGTGWELTSIQDVTSSVEISIFTSSATWTRPAGTKAIRVLAQGGGGGGGSGANRNSAVSAIGGSGGSSGGYIDSGVFIVSEDTVPVVVGRGGKGAVYPVSGSTGIAGSLGNASFFGTDIKNNNFYVLANGGNRGLGGTLNSAVTVAGGASQAFGSDFVYDNFMYNNAGATNTGSAGASATSTIGSSITWTTSSTTYYGAGGGAGGGAINANVAYSGGNSGTSILNSGSVVSPNARSAVSSSILSLLEMNVATNSQTNNVFIGSGGGGGASSLITNGGSGSNGIWGSGGGGGGASTSGSSTLTAYDIETISLRHFDLSEATPAGVFSPWGELAPDRSLYGNVFYNGTQNIISTASAGIPNINSLFSDGVLTSSYSARLSSGWDTTSIVANTNITDNFTLESWVYLRNAGQSGDAFLSSILSAGYVPSPANGVLVGINSANVLQIWANGPYGPGTNPRTITLNSWNHIAITKSGTTHTLYLNGTASVYTSTSTVSNNIFGYGLPFSIYTDYNPNAFFKEFMLTNRVKSQAEIQTYYNAVLGNVSGSYPNPSAGIKQGGNGGDGYVAVISYKY